MIYGWEAIFPLHLSLLEFVGDFQHNLNRWFAANSSASVMFKRPRLKTLCWKTHHCVLLFSSKVV